MHDFPAATVMSNRIRETSIVSSVAIKYSTAYLHVQTEVLW